MISGEEINLNVSEVLQKNNKSQMTTQQFIKTKVMGLIYQTRYANKMPKLFAGAFTQNELRKM